MNWSFMDQCGVDLDVMIEYENVRADHYSEIYNVVPR